MSGAGIPQSGLASILALTRPDLAAQQMALGQRQAFAQDLLAQPPQYQPGGVVGPGGAANIFGSKLLGAIMQRSSNKQALDLANQYRAALFSPQGRMQPQTQPQDQAAPPPLSSLPASVTPPIPGQPNSGVTARPLPPLGSMPPGGLPTPPPQAPPQQVAQTQTQQPAQSQSLFDEAVPDIPGIDPRNKFALYAADPGAYYKAYFDSKGLTPEYKNALTASGGDPAKAASLLNAAATKAGSIDLRSEGSALVPDTSEPGGYKRFYGPNENLNEQFIEGPNGTMIAQPIQGGAEAAAAFRGKVKGAEEENTVTEVTLPNGKTVPMYVGAAIGKAPASAQDQNAPLGVRSNNPGNLQPSGQESQYVNPTAGILAASSNLDNYSKNGINTLQGIISTWAPQYDKSGKQINDTPAYVADVSKRLGGVDPNRPLNLTDPNVKGAVLEAMFQHENGNKYQAPGAGNGPQQTAANQQPGKLPELGVSTAQAEVNKSAGEAAANSGHVQANSDALLKAIDGMIAINDQVPDATVLPPDWKARINQAAPNLPGFRGDAGALAQWEQLNSIGVLGGIKNLGLGRVDIPIVKQIQAGGGIPAEVPAADRLRMLQTLKTEVMNNRAVAMNAASNLNKPNATTPPQTPTQIYPSGNQQPRVRKYNPQTGRLE